MCIQACIQHRCSHCHRKYICTMRPREGVCHAPHHAGAPWQHSVRNDKRKKKKKSEINHVTQGLCESRCACIHRDADDFISDDNQITWFRNVLCPAIYQHKPPLILIEDLLKSHNKSLSDQVINQATTNRTRLHTKKAQHMAVGIGVKGREHQRPKIGQKH